MERYSLKGNERSGVLIRPSIPLLYIYGPLRQILDKKSWTFGLALYVVVLVAVILRPPKFLVGLANRLRPMRALIPAILRDSGRASAP